MGQKDTSEAIPLTPAWGLMGGLVVDKPATEIEPTACQACSNLVGYEGKIRPRQGMSTIYAQLPAGYGCYHYIRFVDNTGGITVAALGYNSGTGAVKFYENVGGVWTDRTDVAVLTGSWAVHPRSTQFKGNLYFTTGVDGGLWKWTGPGTNIVQVTNGTASLAPFFLPRILYSWQGRLWMGDCYNDSIGTTRVPYRMAWSDQLVDNVWQGGLSGGNSGFQDLVDGHDEGNDPITAIFDTMQNLIVAKANCMYYGSNVGYPAFYKFLMFEKNIGVASHETVKSLGDTTYWLGSDNVYAMKGMKTEAIGNAIKPRLRQVINPTYINLAVGMIDPLLELYYLFIPPSGSSINSKMFIYSIRDKAWWEADIADTTNIQPTMSYSLFVTPWDTRLIIGSLTGQFFQMVEGVVTDNGTAWSTSWTSKTIDSMRFFHYPLKPPQFETTRMQRFAIHAQSGQIYASFTQGDNLDSMVAVDRRDVGGRGILKFNGHSEKFLSTNFGSRFYTVTLSHPDLSSPALIEGMTMHVTERGAVRIS